MENNEHLKLEISMRRNHHPYMSSTYINGYVKDQSLRNLAEEEIISWFQKVNSEFGRRPQKHSGDKNLTNERTSIQGVWTNTLWNQYPKHMLEVKREIPTSWVDPLPLREYKPLKQRPHIRTRVMRKQLVLPNLVETFDHKL